MIDEHRSRFGAAGRMTHKNTGGPDPSYPLGKCTKRPSQHGIPMWGGPFYLRLISAGVLAGGVINALCYDAHPALYQSINK